MNFSEKLIIGASICLLSACTSSLKSRFVSAGDKSIPLVEGVVYHLPSERLEIAGSYQLLKVSSMDSSAKVLDTFYYFMPSASGAWTISISRYGDPNLAYSINPDMDRKGNIAYSGEGGANQISIGETGMLTGLNYLAEDKSLDIAKNSIKAITNVAALATFPGASVFKAAGAPAAPGEEITYKTIELGVIPFKTTREVEEVINREIFLSEVTDQMRRSPLVAQLKDSGQVNAAKFDTTDPASKMMIPLLEVSSPGKKKISSLEVKETIDLLATADGRKKPVRTIQGVVTRYPGDAKILIKLGQAEGQVVYSSSSRLMAAGGIQHIKIKSQRFGKSKDSLTFSPTTGALTVWAYGRDSSAEKATAAASDLTALAGTSLASYQATQQAELTSERTAVTARLDQESAVITARSEVARLNAELQIAETEAATALASAAQDPSDIVRKTRLDKADLAVIAAKKNLALAEIQLKKAEALQRLGN